jgi:hypothetical protein
MIHLLSELMPEPSISHDGEDMDKKHSKLIMGNVTDIGLNPNRPTNQDYYGTYEGSFGSLLLYVMAWADMPAEIRLPGWQ